MKFFVPLYFSLFFVGMAMLPMQPRAQEKALLNQSGLPIPRFVSLKSDRINVRVGPGRDYPIAWVYTKVNYPVEVIEEFGHWRKIQDKDEEAGWVHFRLLSGERYAIVLPSEQHSFLPFYADASASRRLVMEAEAGAMIRLASCHKDWCKAEAGGRTGWIEKKFLWGVYPQEQFNH